ncbi:ATP-binding protein [Rhizobium pusense]|uniref:ATP-binding protein n=3 Tax=Agrobacterium TaxID=357 RepID=UPI0018E53DA6|nr:ATP-binding protein [Agrobacterium pusense]MDH0911155.1 ATP-binding protein [Agrobacterium pusense]MDH1097224.1 ATP-binding protein [Agrobacterium pusense]MDH1113692.1 ATP-binding protein [Agrobacterium pusense]MDH2193214.1 ATP-binding protein [Agrobacterium pusense]
MLGRQQIAGVQNALVELFKNAHDAYAKRIAVDHFEDFGSDGEGFLMVRDNGVGMTHADFVNKWLVLGTESKAVTSAPPYRPPDAEPRPITGEKGIGRLAIALLGRQTLVLTRAVRADGVKELVVGLIHWGLFEIPGLNLEEIEVPVETIAGGGLPGDDVLLRMREQIKACALRIRAEHPEADVDIIIGEIEGFQPDLNSVYGFLKSSEEQHLSLDDGAVGTHFLIAPSNPVIKLDLASEDRDGDYGFRKFLLGFSDSVFGKEHRESITTSFRRWRNGDAEGEELLDPTTFFTRQELTEFSDHLLEGAVDEYGQFSGRLRVYDRDYEIVVPWAGSNGRQTKCGPFDVNFGYLMGRPTESRLSAEHYHPLNDKMNHIGGLYVYRDGVRILPYGDYSFDWLDVEKRRNKGAGYYFFSFRRMLGAVMLTRDKNGELQEKAGREGFQQNEAYRQVRDILMNLLVQLAADFFRKSGSNADAFETAQAEIRKRSAALERQQKRSATKRKNFASALNAFSEDIRANLPVSEVANLMRVTQARMDSAALLPDQDKAATALIRAEQEAITAIAAMRQKYTKKRPAGIALGKELQRDWDAYVIEHQRLETEVFAPFEQQVATTLGTVAEQARVYVDQRKRLEERIKSLATERKKDLAEAVRQTNATASDTRQTVLTITERARIALDETVRAIQADLNRTDLAGMEPAKIDEMRRKWEDQLTDIEGRHRDALMAARDMLASLAENLRASDGEEPAQVMQAMEERMMALEEQADEDFEMVQLGLAVAIINHEFAASIKRVRTSVQELGKISRRSDGLRPVYESIRSNFEHLDGHLNLFTPLQRRLHRTALKIDGRDISNYCNDLFSNRFERHKVELKITPQFTSAVFECYPSTLYPAVINVIDNALFWLNSIRSDRRIELHADENAIYISNNGPPIEPQDVQRIFERGFSRKAGGRGLGLFISAKALQAEGLGLEPSLSPRTDYNVTFVISIENIGDRP